MIEAVKSATLRLLILTSEFPPGPGGIGTHAYNLASQLHGLGWKVTVIGRQDYVAPEECQSFNCSLPFDVMSLRPLAWTAVDAAYRWGKVIPSALLRQADVIMLTGLQSVWLGAALPRRAPVVAIGHGTEFGVSGWRLALARAAFERANHVVCVSEFTRDYMLKKGIVPKNVSVIHNGADHRTFFRLPENETAEFKRRQGYNGYQLLLTVGHVSERKGQDIVIRALPAILSEFPKAHYLIAGLPSQQSEYQRLAQQLGVENHVHFLGKVSTGDLVHLYNACDIFVLTSRHTDDGDFEGYGIVAIEAALCGAPAVVAGGSGLSEAVKNGVTGLVVPPEAPSETAEALTWLLRDQNLRQSLADQARFSAETEQTWAKRAATYDALFRDLARQ